MSTDIKLTFINESNDRNNSNVVVFQKNLATNFDETDIAWKVIKNCGVGWSHPFTYPMEFNISAADAWGNQITEPKLAANGDAFHVTRDASGDVLSFAGPSVSRKEIELRNNLQQGAIDAHIYKDGKLLAAKTAIAPMEKATFSFKPTIWIGVASQIEEGQVMNSAIVSQINTEIGLLGIASAEIVMSGGGPGANSSPFKFTIDNVVYF